jgi:hypothetical protein
MKDMASITKICCDCGHDVRPMITGAGRQYDPLSRKTVNLGTMWICPNRFLKSEEHPEGREGGPVCRNSITVSDYEKILLCISDKCSRALLRFEEPDLTTEGEFTPPRGNYLHCRVIKHDEDEIRICVRNGRQTR